MNPVRWKRIDELFRKAADLPPDDRAAFLKGECDDDPLLIAEVEELLAQDQKATGELPSMGGTIRSELLASATGPDAAWPEIDGYAIRRVLGEGGMGIVYEAQQHRPHRLVAIKVIRAGLTGMKALRRFEHEIELLGRLQHSGIAQIYDVGTADTGRGPQPYFAMEHIDGQPLLAYVKETTLSIRERLALFATICDAVEHAHQKGIIHRDLKPANVLVTSDGQTKILDFGVARATDADLQATTLQTDMGQLIGTLPYMSPEQVSGDPGELDIRSDVYALGVTLFELLCGTLPYTLQDRPVPDAVRIIRDEEPTRLSSVSRTLGGDIETIVGKALEKEKDQRYQSARELGSDVLRYLANEPIAARPPSAAYQLRKFAARNRVLCGGVLTTLVALVSGIIGTATFAVQAEQRRAAAEESAFEAEQSYSMARDSVKFVVNHVADRLQHVPGTREIRSQLLQEAYEKYLDLLARPSDDVEVQHDYAAALLRRADLFLEEGRLQEATSDVDQARSLLQALTQAHPSRAGYRRALQQCYAREAHLAWRRGDLATAEQCYRRACDGFAALVAGEHSVPGDRVLWAEALDRLGRIAGERGAYEEQLQHYQEFLAVADHPGAAALRSQVSVAHERLGDWHASRGEPHLADQHYVNALAIREVLAQEDPSDWRNLDNLAWAHERVGKRDFLAGRHEAALDHYKQSVKIFERLIELEPTRQRFRANLVDVLWSIGALYSEIGEKGAAEDSTQRRLEMCQELVAREPANPSWRLRLAWCYGRLGDIARDRGEFPTAHGYARRMVDELNDMIAEFGRRPAWLSDLAEAYRRLWGALPSGPYSPDAHGVIVKRREILEDLHSKYPDNRDHATALALALDHEGRYLWRVHKDAATRRLLWERANALYQSAHAADPTQQWLAVNVGWGMMRRGQMAMDDGDYRTAAQEYGELCRFADQLDATYEGGKTLLWLRLNAYGDWGSALNALADFSDATVHLSEAQMLAGQLLDQEPKNPEWLRAQAKISAAQAVAARGLDDTYAEQEYLRRAVEVWSALPPEDVLGADDAAQYAGCLLRLAEYAKEADEATDWLGKAQTVLFDPAVIWSAELVAPRRQLAAALLRRGEYAKAEEILRSTSDDVFSSAAIDQAAIDGVCEGLAKLYERWHAAEPGQGYDTKAAEWRATLAALSAGDMQAPESPPDSDSGPAEESNQTK